jgi:hypothetical protein
MYYRILGIEKSLYKYEGEEELSSAVTALMGMWRCHVTVAHCGGASTCWSDSYDSNQP